MRRILVLILLILCSTVVHAQTTGWRQLGTISSTPNTNCVSSLLTGCSASASSTGGRNWMKLNYNPIQQCMIYWGGNPNSLSGTLSESMNCFDVTHAIANCSSPCTTFPTPSSPTPTNNALLWSWLNFTTYTLSLNVIGGITCNPGTPNTLTVQMKSGSFADVYLGHSGPNIYNSGPSYTWISGTGTLTTPYTPSPYDSIQSGPYQLSHINSFNTPTGLPSYTSAGEYYQATNFTLLAPNIATCPPAYGPNTSTAACNANQNACLGSPYDTPTEPVGRHYYGGMDWDKNRNILWAAFGTGALGDPHTGTPTSGNGAVTGDSSITDFYKFDPSHTPAPLWTAMCTSQLPGIVPSCGSIGIEQEGAMAHDPIHDILFMVGGTSSSTPNGRVYCIRDGSTPVGAGSCPNFGSGIIPSNTWTAVPSTGSFTGPSLYWDFPSVRFDPTASVAGHSGEFVIMGGNWQESGAACPAHTFAAGFDEGYPSPMNMYCQPNRTYFFDPQNGWTVAFTSAASTFNIDMPSDPRSPPCDYDPVRTSIICIADSGSQATAGTPWGTSLPNLTTATVWEWKSSGSTGTWTQLTIPGFAPPINNGVSNNIVTGNSGGYDQSANAFFLMVNQASPAKLHAYALPLPSTLSTTIAAVNAVALQGWPGDTPPGSTGRVLPPVTSTIPLPDSGQFAGTIGGSPPTLELQNGSGTQLNSQFYCTEDWSDGFCSEVKFDYQPLFYTDNPNTVDTSASIVQVSSGGGNFPNTTMLQQCTGSGTPDAYCQNSNQYLIRTKGGLCNVAGSACFLVNVQNNDYIDEANVNGSKLYTAARTKTPTTDGVLLMGPAYVGNVIASTQCPTISSCTTPYSSINDSSSTATVEENGPLRSVLRIDGNLKDSAGDIYTGYTLRYEFWANHSDFHVEFLHRNAYCSGAPCQAGNVSVEDAAKQFASLQILSTNNLGTSTHNVRFGNDTAVPTTMALSTATPQTAYLYIGFTTDLQWQDWPSAPNCASYGDECVRSFIQRTNGTTYAQNGIEIVNASGTEVAPHPDNSAICATSTGAAGWMTVDDGSGGGTVGSIGVGIFHPCAFWPKGLEDSTIGTGTASTIAIDIWPNQNNALVNSNSLGPIVYQIEWFHYQIHDIYMSFSPAPVNNQVAVDTYLQEEHPIESHPAWSYYNTVSDVNGTLAYLYPFIDPNAEDTYYCAIGLCGTGTNCPSSIIGTCIPDFTEIPGGSAIPPKLAVFRFYSWTNGGAGNQNDFMVDYGRNCLQRWPVSSSTAGFLPARCTFAHIFWPRYLLEGTNGGRADGFDWRDSAHCGAISGKCTLLDVNGYPALIPWNGLQANRGDKGNQQDHFHVGGIFDIYQQTGARDIYDAALNEYLNVLTNTKVGNNNPAFGGTANRAALGVTRAVGWMVDAHARFARHLAAIQFVDTVGGCSTVACSVSNALAGADLALAWQAAPYLISGGWPKNYTEANSGPPGCPYLGTGQCSPDTTGPLASVGISPTRGEERASGGPSNGTLDCMAFNPSTPVSPCWLPTQSYSFAIAKPFMHSIFAEGLMTYGNIVRGIRGAHWTLPFTGINSGAQTGLALTISDWQVQNWSYATAHFSTGEAFTLSGPLNTGSNSTCTTNCINSGGRYVIYDRYLNAEPGCSLNDKNCDPLCPTGFCIGTSNDANWAAQADTVGASVGYDQNEPLFQQQYEYHIQKAIPANSGDSPEWAGLTQQMVVGSFLANPSPTTYALGSPATLQYVPGGVTITGSGATSSTVCQGGTGGKTCALHWLTPIPGLTTHHGNQGSLQFYSCLTADPDCNSGNGKTIIDSLGFSNYLTVGATSPILNDINKCTVNAPVDPSSNEIPGCYQFNPTTFWPWQATFPVETVGSVPNISSGTYTFSPAANTTYTFAVKAYQPPVTAPTCPPAVVSVVPTSINFGTITVGTPAPATVTVCNGTAFTINSLSQTVTGTNAPDFPSSIPGSGGCGASLLAGNQCNITDTFIPSIPSSESATLNINYTSPGGGAVTSLSCSQSDIQNAITSLGSTGGVVTVPAGSCSWSTQFAPTFSGPITLQGATTCTNAGLSSMACTDNTNITLNCTTVPCGATGQDNVVITGTTATNTFYIAGFTFIDDSGSTNGTIRFSGGSPHNAVTFSFYGNHIKANGGGTGGNFLKAADSYSFVGNNLWTETSGSGWAPPITVYGDGSTGGNSNWQDATGLGTNQATFLEGNTYNAMHQNTEGFYDGYTGCKVVVRYNYILNSGNMGTHGFDSTPESRSCVFDDINNNTMVNTGSSLNPLTVRGGVQLFWNNTLTGTWSASTLDYFRLHPTDSFGHKGVAGVGINWIPQSVSTSGNWDFSSTNSADWLPSNSYTGPVTILPTSSNAGNYNYYSATSCTSSGTRPAFNQTQGNNTTDGSCTWLNIGGVGASGVTGQGWSFANPDILISGGTRNLDNNFNANNYPLRDQPCVGHLQIVTPCYEWGNTGQTEPFFNANSSTTTYLQSGRDFFNLTPMPGYTPFTYPYPIASVSTISIPLSGVGQAAGTASLTPISQTFATTTAGSGHSTDSPRTFTFTNNTSANITVSSSSITTGNLTDFGVQTDNCSGHSIPHTGSNTCTILVFFSPLLADTGILNSQLQVVTASAGTFSSTLTGQSNSPALNIPPSPIQPVGVAIGP